ncbi:hypothetical protein HPS36_01135 [Halorubrum salinarum]|uniref:Uncharacterized protein n=1 Tax=Halorubrum salinarum TaxID=2739057 RepID=A0A7D3XXD9_9EURY|nr:hypothetical protein [Halorubrum salinarum]QKG91514.1 hypothetical protein HPS36_01135 [Halorubrum salinarum]
MKPRSGHVHAMPYRRRRVLTVGGSLSLVALTGCSGGLDQLGGGSSQLEAQKAVVDQFVTGVNEDDLDAVDEAVGSWAAGAFTADNIGDYTFDRGDLRRTDRDETYVILETELTITHRGDSRTEAVSFRLSQSREEWYIEQILVVGGLIIDGEPLGPPSVFMDAEFDSEATDGDETGVLTVRHSGGGPLPARGTAFFGTIVDPEGADPDISTAGATIAEATQRSRFGPGDSVTVGVETEYDVTVTYTKQGLGKTVLLQDFTPS